MSKKGWVDFKAVRAAVSFKQVLDFYGVEYKEKGADQIQCYCPLPSGHDGERRSPSFSVNKTKGIFQCFGCKAKGNIIDFVTLMDNRDVRDGNDALRSARFLQKEFIGVSGNETRTSKPQKPVSKTDSSKKKKGSVVVNAPLTFTLKNLDSAHEFLVKREFDDIASEMGAGYCSKGLMKGRIAIPIKNKDGLLVGYAGRIVDDSKIDEDNPKYLFPGKREKGGEVFEFHKSAVLYNENNIVVGGNKLVVVEGFTDVWRVLQAGFKKVVGIMGSSVSEEQITQILDLVREGGSVFIMTDNDKAGNRLATELILSLADYRKVRRIPLGDNLDPADYTPEDLYSLLVKSDCY